MNEHTNTNTFEEGQFDCTVGGRVCEFVAGGRAVRAWALGHSPLSLSRMPCLRSRSSTLARLQVHIYYDLKKVLQNYRKFRRDTRDLCNREHRACVRGE